MKKLTKNRLLELGFVPEYNTYWKGDVFLEHFPEEKSMSVYVSARITGSADYARPAVGVKNESDLMELCRLVNGKP